MAKLIAAKCPTCGASLPVPPGAHHVQCRYCGNAITVEVRKPPPMHHPYGMPGGMPSRTLYLDPEAVAAAGKGIGAIIALSVILPVVVAIIGAAAAGVAMFKGSGGALVAGSESTTKASYPATCGMNQRIELTGDWQGPGPVVTEAGVNCKIRITNAKLKASRIVQAAGPNVELTLENVVVETTEAAITGGINMKVRVTGGSITSAAEAITSNTANLEVTLTNTSVTSTGRTAIDGGSNLSLTATGSEIRGKRSAVDAGSNAKLKLKATELAGEDNAIKASSSLGVYAEGGAITALAGPAIESDSSTSLELEGTKVKGRSAAVSAKSSLKVRASKKASLVATSGNAIEGTSSLDVVASDASVEGARAALKGTSSIHVKLTEGARFAGGSGGLVAESAFDLDTTNATIEGGKGPGIQATSGAKVALHGGVVRGLPAISFSHKPSAFTVDGTKIEGEQKLGR